MTDDEVRELALRYLANPLVRGAMDAFRMTEEEYIASLRRLYPYPTYTSTTGPS